MRNLNRKLALCAALMALWAAPASAQAPVLDLHIMSDGLVSIDNGPALDMRQFRARIEALKKQHPQPDLKPRVDDQLPFGAVAIVFQVVQDAQYDAHLKMPEADRRK